MTTDRKHLPSCRSGHTGTLEETECGCLEALLLQSEIRIEEFIEVALAYLNHTSIYCSGEVKARFNQEFSEAVHAGLQARNLEPPNDRTEVIRKAAARLRQIRKM